MVRQMSPCLDAVTNLQWPVISYRRQSHENLQGLAMLNTGRGGLGGCRSTSTPHSQPQEWAETCRGGCFGLGSSLTSENFPSPNHCTHRMPETAWRLAVALWETTIAGHQEKPLIFPQTSSPIPNSFPS